MVVAVAEVEAEAESRGSDHSLAVEQSQLGRDVDGNRHRLCFLRGKLHAREALQLLTRHDDRAHVVRNIPAGAQSSQPASTRFRLSFTRGGRQS